MRAVFDHLSGECNNQGGQLMGREKLKKDPYNVIISGVGGQGNVLLSGFIGTALLNEGFIVSVVDTFGVSQRGGSVSSHIKISEKTLYSSVTLKGKADVIVGMEPVETLRTLVEFGNPSVMSIVNPRPFYPSGGVAYPDLGEVRKTINKMSSKTWYVQATEEALRMGNPIYTNIILLGAVVGSGILPLRRESMIPLLVERFPDKLLDININAFNRGMALISEA
jgi:indolepyruvate ferredoxin oxidoreductase beta subunit